MDDTFNATWAWLTQLMLVWWSQVTWVQVLEYGGSACSIIGAEMLSSRHRQANWGWAIWLVANIFLLSFALASNLWGIVLMQIWFMKTSVAGMRNHLMPSLKPVLK